MASRVRASSDVKKRQPDPVLPALQTIAVPPAAPASAALRKVRRRIPNHLLCIFDTRSSYGFERTVRIHSLKKSPAPSLGPAHLARKYVYVLCNRRSRHDCDGDTLRGSLQCFDLSAAFLHRLGLTRRPFWAHWRRNRRPFSRLHRFLRKTGPVSWHLPGALG